MTEKPTINLRITLDAPIASEEEETYLVADVLAETNGAVSVVVPRNNGFGTLLPDESTRQDMP